MDKRGPAACCLSGRDLVERPLSEQRHRRAGITLSNEISSELRRIPALWINPKRRYQNKNESNGERNKGISFIVRAALHDCAPDLRFWTVERLADFFWAIVRLPPNCPSAVGRYGPELRGR